MRHSCFPLPSAVHICIIIDAVVVAFPQQKSQLPRGGRGQEIGEKLDNKQASNQTNKPTNQKAWQETHGLPGVFLQQHYKNGKSHLTQIND